MTNTLTATITGTEDTTGNVPINRGLGNLAFSSATVSQFAEFVSYQRLNNGDNPIVIPGPLTKASQVYVKNLDATNNIVVKYTPSGGVQQLSTTLGPGEVFIIWQAQGNSATGAGITAFVLNASAANVLCEYFLGG